MRDAGRRGQGEWGRAWVLGETRARSSVWGYSSRSPRKLAYRCSLLPHSAAVIPAPSITSHSSAAPARSIRACLRNNNPLRWVIIRLKVRDGRVRVQKKLQRQMRSSVRCSCLPPTPPFLSSHRSDFVLTSLFSPRRDTGQQCALPGGWQLYRYRGVRIYRLGKEVKEKIKKKKASFRQKKWWLIPLGKLSQTASFLPSCR